MTLTAPQAPARPPLTAMGAATLREMIRQLHSDCRSTQLLACRNLALLGAMAAPALPALWGIIDEAHDRTKLAAQTALEKILREVRKGAATTRAQPIGHATTFAGRADATSLRR